MVHTSEVEGWTVEDVGRWLNERGLGQFAKVFSDAEVDGDVLLDLTEADLLSLGITHLGHRRRLLRELAHIVSSIVSPTVCTVPSVHKILSAEPLAVHYCLEAIPIIDTLYGNGLEDQPFKNDQEYLSSTEAIFHIRRALTDIEPQLLEWSVSTVGPPGSRGITAFPAPQMRLRFLARINTTLKRLEDVLIELQAKRLGLMEMKPRILRLGDRLELSKKECEALQYILLWNVGAGFASEVWCSHKGMAKLVARYTKLNPLELLDFLRPTRPHLSQGLFEPEDEFSTLLTTGFLKMSQEIMRALCGATLSTEEFYKIDKTGLSDVLSEEPGFATVDIGNANGTETSGADNSELESELNSLMGDGKDGSGTEGMAVDDADNQQLTRSIEPRTSRDVTPSPSIGAGRDGMGSISFEPYSDDLEYLEDNFKLLETRFKIRGMELTQDDPDILMSLRADSRKPESVLRELRAKERSLLSKVDNRMQATRKVGPWLPRLERVVELRELDDFEKNVLLALVGGMISHSLRKSGKDKVSLALGKKMDIGTLVALLSEGLPAQIRSRPYFYKNARLVREGLITLSDPPFMKGQGSDLMDTCVELDRKLLDYIVGLDTELGEIVDGSELYLPSIPFDRVVLSPRQKELILSTISHYDKFRQCCKEINLDQTLVYGRGICLLFYGPSGTGKTMTANAIGSFLGKKVLLVNVAVLANTPLTKEIMRFLFREAKIHDAILFFDECENLLESRNKNSGQTPLHTMLTELEAYDGLIILATNRQQDIDDAMQRRISLAVEFPLPDFQARTQIWKTHIPPGVELKEAVDWDMLALNFELSGGLIKNAVLSALSHCIRRGEEKFSLTTEDLIYGAKLQLRGLLQRQDFDRRIIPDKGLESLVLSNPLRASLESIITFEKSRKVLCAQWGFDNEQAQGTIVLFTGPPGTGKSTAAAALGYELGQPLKEINCSELLARVASGLAKTMDSVFADARSSNAVVVLEEADGFFGGVHLWANGSIGPGSVPHWAELSTLLFHINRYHGVVVVIGRDRTLIGPGLFKRLNFHVHFDLPSEETRLKLWKSMVPDKTPLGSDVNLQALARRYPFTPGSIKTAVLVAAERALQRQQPIKITDGTTIDQSETTFSPQSNSDRSTVVQSDLEEAARVEAKRLTSVDSATSGPMSMYQ